MTFPKHPAADSVSPWEVRLWDVSRSHRERGSRPPLTMIIPASVQIPTPNREFLLTTPSEGVSYVATMARDAGWDVEIVDMRMGVSGEEAAARAVARGGAVAMPTFADSYLHNEHVLRLVKEAAPMLPTIVGGSLISSLPKPILEHVKADYSVLHEGELTFFELLEHLAAGGTREGAHGIEGLAIRDDQGNVVLTPPREQIRNLDAVPIPDLFLYPSVRLDPRIPEIGLTTQRGCYARCTFCFVNIKKIRFKSVPRVEEELSSLLRNHFVSYMYLNDLTFTADRKRTWALCEALGRSGITWSCSTRVEAADPELLAHMHANGCRDIWYGVESVDQTVLDFCNKKQTVDQIVKAVRATQAAGIKVAANFIVGLPGESHESLQAMYDFILDMDVVPASIKYLSPFPGTPIYDDAIRRGILPGHIPYLEHLSRRQVNRIDDEYFNVTTLPDQVIRDAFARLCELRDAQVRKHFPGAGMDAVSSAAPAGVASDPC
jgi:anaerobic magnesium-protoporphyrin IX monomethyl ester cyclase